MGNWLRAENAPRVGDSTSTMLNSRFVFPPKIEIRKERRSPLHSPNGRELASQSRTARPLTCVMLRAFRIGELVSIRLGLPRSS